MLVWLAGWPHSGSALCRNLIEQTLELPSIPEKQQRMIMYRSMAVKNRRDIRR